MAETRSTQEQAPGSSPQQQTGSGPSSEQIAGAARQAREYASGYERQGQMGQTGQAGQAGQYGQYGQAGSTGQTWQAGRQRDTAGHARDTINQAYTRASQGMNDTWEHAMDYSKEHPATATLLAFGAGIGLGLVIGGGLGGFQSRRWRTRRIVPPVLDALSLLSREFFG
ncbi:MAG: hypothetical protein J2P41_07995 [Blastocatellia bacterium]|nr:hypothetical protein [Blastocatellia bacterium]